MGVDDEGREGTWVGRERKTVEKEDEQRQKGDVGGKLKRCQTIEGTTHECIHIHILRSC